MNYKRVLLLGTLRACITVSFRHKASLQLEPKIHSVALDSRFSLLRCWDQTCSIAPLSSFMQWVSDSGFVHARQACDQHGAPSVWGTGDPGLSPSLTSPHAALWRAWCGADSRCLHCWGGLAFLPAQLSVWLVPLSPPQWILLWLSA